MSLQAHVTYQVPEVTAAVAQAIFPTGNLVMRMYDELGMLVPDADFADLFPPQGQPAEAPAQLALVTLLQFWEGLTNRQAADAVRTRIDWKYLLCLELTDRGVDHTVLSEFRTRLLAHRAERRLFDAILTHARTRGLLKAGGRQRSDSTHILGAMRMMTRLETVTETLRHALNRLTMTAPEWVRRHTTPEWVDRYGVRASEYRLPKGQAKRLAWAEQIGRDRYTILSTLYADSTVPDLRRMPAIETLRQVWIQNLVIIDGQLTWRDNDTTPPSGRSSYRLPRNGFRLAMGCQHNALTPIRRTADDTRQVFAQIGQAHLHFTHWFPPLFLSFYYLYKKYTFDTLLP